MKKKRLPATANPDLDRYIIVHSKEGDYLRAKRKTTFVNAALAEMAAETCSGAAKQILTKLKPFTERMVGRMNVRLSGKIRSAKKQGGFYDYSLLQGFELQKNHPLAELYKEIYTVKNSHGKLELAVPVTSGCVKQYNKIVTAFYFEAVLLMGDAMVAESLRVEEERSKLFYFDRQYHTAVVFTFIVPDNTPYLLWLKVGCMEGDEPANHGKHYGMRVVAVG